MNVAFTGTRKGMTPKQRASVAALLRRYYKGDEDNRFLFGWCIGADDQAAMIAANIGYTLIAYPGASTPDKRGSITPHIKMTAEENLKRNRRMVDECDVLIAGPSGRKEQRRSGTWATVRYASKIGRQTKFAYPDWRKGDG